MSGHILLQSAANMDDPREHIAWALVALAGPQSHAPLIVPKVVTGDWSEQLHEAGFRHHPELQKIKYVPPSKNTNWVMGAAGRWVAIDEELSAAETAPDVSHLTPEEKMAVFQSLGNELFPAAPEAPRAGAEVL